MVRILTLPPPDRERQSSAFGARLSSVDPSQKSTWAGQVFLTFDFDWAHHDIVADCLGLLAGAGFPSSTWFVTHETPILEILRETPGVELGIHPNFRPLLGGSSYRGDARDEIGRLMRIVPDARAVRSHSVVTGSPLSEIYREYGITHESNVYIPASSGIEVRPWFSQHGLVQAPFSWADDVSTYRAEPEALQLARANLGLLILDFHPIHIFLNTETMDRYELTREIHHRPDDLVAHRYKGYGTRNRFLELIHGLAGDSNGALFVGA